MRVTIELRRPTRRATVVLTAIVLFAAPTAVLAVGSFTDVPTTHPFYADIMAIANAGVTAGYADGGYHPSEPVTRQAMAAFMRRGFGRASMAQGFVTMTSSLDVGANSYGTAFVAVRQIQIIVPGATNGFEPTQLVHLQGHVGFLTSMGISTKGCPCEFSARITEPAIKGTWSVLNETFESISQSTFNYGFDVEALLVASPGPHTYQLEVALSARNTANSAASFGLSTQSSLSAETFPFGAMGDKKP